MKSKICPFYRLTIAIDPLEVRAPLQALGGRKQAFTTINHRTNYTKEGSSLQGFLLPLPFLPRRRYTLSIEMLEEHVYSVSELNSKARGILEKNFGSVWLKGELSNLVRAPSGHLYFTIKDKASEIAAARFKGHSALLPAPVLENGMEILAFGRLTIYEPRGRYQFIVSLIQPAGLGALQLAFERLKEKLKTEGLFDAGHKKPISPFPHRIGVITSPAGAAIRDILSTLERRWPLIEVFLFPSAVQGDCAADEIISAIACAEAFSSTQASLDLLILGRGGGSLEDLAVFNDEQVARSIFACPIPIVSAVGHEIDFTIADFVADLRAPTPSAAAELVTPNRTEQLGLLSSWITQTVRHLDTMFNRRTQRLQSSLKGYIFQIPNRKVERLNQDLDFRLGEILRHTSEAWKKRSREGTRLEGFLRLSDPTLPFRRGYSLTFPLGKPIPLRDAASLSPGQCIETRLQHGSIISQVEEVTAS